MKVYSEKTGRKVQMFMHAFHSAYHAGAGWKHSSVWWDAASNTLAREAFYPKDGK